MQTWTETEFERLSWHDCHIWRLTIRTGDPDRGDWTSDLELDLDFIVEWLCGTDGSVSFRVAPATLTFHDVSGLHVAISWGGSGDRTAVHEISIDRIEREPVAGQQEHVARPCHRYTVHTNWPAGGRLSFAAARFTQRLGREPIFKKEQWLSSAERLPAQGDQL